MTLEELKKEEILIRESLQNNLEKQHEIENKEFCDKHGYYIGNIIEYMNFNKLTLGLITDVCSCKRVYFVSPFSKLNNNFSTLSRALREECFNSFKLIKQSSDKVVIKK